MFKRKRRKGQASIEVLALLLIALAIAGVSAAVYNYLYMLFSPVRVEEAKIRFVEGADSVSAGASIGTNGTFVSFNSISGWPNVTRVYEDVARIKNYGTSNRNIRLVFLSWSGNTEAVEYIYVKVFNESDEQQGDTINVGTQGSSTGDLTIPASAEWRVQWEIKWEAGALSTNSVSVTLQLIVTGE